MRVFRIDVCLASCYFPTCQVRVVRFYVTDSQLLLFFGKTADVSFFSWTDDRCVFFFVCVCVV